MQRQINTTPWTRGGNLTGEKYILPVTKSSERALIKQKVKCMETAVLQPNPQALNYKITTKAP
jgi:hypothetical protein